MHGVPQRYADPNNADGALTRAELEQRLPLPEVRIKLKHAFCKFPTELNQATIEDRWGWLVGDAKFGLLQEDFNELSAHVQALTIPWDAGWLPNSHWHVQPREFVTMWRKCGWLSENELRQLVPVRAVRGQGAGLRGPFFYESMQRNAGQIIGEHFITLNRMLRKFSVIIDPASK